MPAVIKPDLVRALVEGFKKEPRLSEAACPYVPKKLNDFSKFVQCCSLRVFPPEVGMSFLVNHSGKLNTKRPPLRDIAVNQHDTCCSLVRPCVGAGYLFVMFVPSCASSGCVCCNGFNTGTTAPERAQY